MGQISKKIVKRIHMNSANNRRKKEEERTVRVMLMGIQEEI